MQTSSKSLPAAEVTRLAKLFSTLLADLKHPNEVNTFINDFFSQTEKMAFLKRLAIIDALDKGLSYEEIHKKLTVSSATISSIAELKKTKGVCLALEKIKADESAEKVLKKFRSYFRNRIASESEF